MKLLLSVALPGLAAFAVIFLFTSQKTPLDSTAAFDQKNNSSKIQVAILLDVSNSMDGLIDQAKAQLWNMVGTLGKAVCNGQSPQIEIALYEYGRPTNNVAKGYVKQINGFISDLDLLSQNLFELKTNGGDEYCGHVIYSSIKELGWDTSSTNYKVIFIAGNEDFLQGDVSWTTACNAAKNKGVIVNTIYCGDNMSGIREHWKLGGECGSGSYTNINQDATIEDIATPYDSTLFVLNDQLNGTYVTYGLAGASSFSKQADMDRKNYTMNKKVAAERVEVKANKKLYKTSKWDLVDAVADDESFIDKVDVKTLPDSLKNKSRAELQQLVKVKAEKRTALQSKIAGISLQRQTYITNLRKKTSANNQTTLETEIEKILKKQVQQYNMIIQ